MEIYQIHWPFGTLSSRYWDGLADCVDQGLVKVRRRRRGTEVGGGTVSGGDRTVRAHVLSTIFA